MLDIDGGARKADFVQEHREAAIPLAEAADALNHVAGADGEIRDAVVHDDVTEPVVNLGEGVAHKAAVERIIALMTAGEHDVPAFHGFVVKLHDFLRLILQVAVHHDDPLAAHMVQTGGDGEMLAVVPTELDAAHLGIALADALDEFPVVLRAAVIDENDLVVRRNLGQRLREPAVHLGDAFGTFVGRGDDG